MQGKSANFDRGYYIKDDMHQILKTIGVCLLSAAIIGICHASVGLKHLKFQGSGYPAYYQTLNVSGDPLLAPAASGRTGTTGLSTSSINVNYGGTMTNIPNAPQAWATASQPYKTSGSATSTMSVAWEVYAEVYWPSGSNYKSVTVQYYVDGTVFSDSAMAYSMISSGSASAMSEVSNTYLNVAAEQGSNPSPDQPVNQSQLPSYMGYLYSCGPLSLAQLTEVP